MDMSQVYIMGVSISGFVFVLVTVYGAKCQSCDVGGRIFFFSRIQIGK